MGSKVQEGLMNGRHLIAQLVSQEGKLFKMLQLEGPHNIPLLKQIKQDMEQRFQVKLTTEYIICGPDHLRLLTG